MKPAEQILADRVAPLFVDRDQVRGWVVQEQFRGRRKRIQFVLAIGLGFMLLGAGWWSAMSHQYAAVCRMVERRPSLSVVSLNEIAHEVCHAPPAKYFVDQLSRRPASHRSISTSVATR